MSRHAGALLALLVALLVAAAPALAIDPAERGEAFNRIEKKTMCIECNVPLNIAEAAQADATRAQIRLLLDRGLSEEQVLDRLVEDYGANILASPRAKGFNALAYLVPVAALAALLALGGFLLPRWRRNRGEGPSDDVPPRDPPSSSDHERLDAELARYGT